LNNEDFDEQAIIDNIYVHGANDRNKNTPVTLETSMTSDQCKRLMKSETKLQEFEYNAF
jgi:anti-sigma regulatory factor (Ser/Thr protein kinase)